jgi:hypothetical protein
MVRWILEQHLAQAERHVAEGENNIARQRQIIAELASGGYDLAVAQQLEATQASHVADCDRLRAQLAAIP